MSDKKYCDNGDCPRVRDGEVLHLQHLKTEDSRSTENIDLGHLDKDSFFRSRRKVQGLFTFLITLAGILSFVSTFEIVIQIVKIAATILSIVSIGLALAVLNKGDSMKSRDQIDSIEKKMNTILELLEKDQTKKGDKKL